MAADTWDLASLESGRAGLTPAEACSLVEAAAVCFEATGAKTTVQLALTGEFGGTMTLRVPRVTDQIRRTYADVVHAVERGACAVAALLCERQMGMSIVEQSWRGGAFDYWLGESAGELFQRKAKLEVSGILRGDVSHVRRRLMEKLGRLPAGDSPWTTWIVVVEFSQPSANAVRR